MTRQSPRQREQKHCTAVQHCICSKQLFDLGNWLAIPYYLVIICREQAAEWDRDPVRQTRPDALLFYRDYVMASDRRARAPWLRRACSFAPSFDDPVSYTNTQ